MEKIAVKTTVVIGLYILAFWLCLPGFLLSVGLRLDALVPVNLMKDAWFERLGWILLVSGFMFMALGMERLWSRGEGLPVSHFPPRRFVAAGLYRIVRHPIYLGFNLAFAGTAMAIGSFWSLAFSTPLLSAGWMAYALTYEEPALLVRFGESYRDYRRKTPLLVPARLGRLVSRAARPIGHRICRALSGLARRPVLFRRGDFIFVTYGLFVSVGTILFTQLTSSLWIAQGLPKNRVAVLHVFDVLAASFFAYAFWWLAHRRELVHQPRFGLNQIGFVSYGALAGLLFSCSVFAAIQQVPLGPITDAMVRGMFIAYAFGRLGCVSYGCCWGVSTAGPGILYRNPASKVLRVTGRPYALCRPAAAYSFLEGLVLVVLLNLLALLPFPAGVLTALSFVLYSIGRFFIESARERTRYIFGRFHKGHLGSVATAAAGLALLFILPKSAARPAPRFWDPAVFVPSLSLVPVSFLVGALVFLIAGVHRKKVGSW